MATTLSVYRWSTGGPERWQAFAVEAGSDTTVLDALVEIQRRQDPSLAFRYACRVGMCGSCAMVVNGRERWACRTRLATLGAGPVTVRPLYHLPLLGDLVVDMAPFAAKLREVGAALVPAPDAESYALIPPGSAERRDIDPAIECIGCGMCVSACTMVAHNERFPGPAAFNRAFTLQMDHRLRQPSLLGVGQAEHFVGCSELWVEAQGLPHRGHTLLYLSLLQQESPQVVACTGEVRIDTGCLAIE